MDTMVRLEWKCNACGARFDEPEDCEHCGTSHCPECKIANSLMNVRVWDRFVSHNKPTPYRKPEKKAKQPKEKRKPGKKNVARLLDELGI